MKVILTGGAGFIGSALLSKLNKMGISDILVVDHLSGNGNMLNLEGKQYKDFVDKTDFYTQLHQNKLDTRTDLVIHFGACTSTTESNESYIMQNNYTYSKDFAQWALKHKIKFLYASSAATYGSGNQGFSDDDQLMEHLLPLNLYGKSKHYFDQWVLKLNLQTQLVGFKFFNVFGPNEYHKASMMSLIAKSFPKVNAEGKIRLFKSYQSGYGNGDQKRDFIYVKDVIDMVYFFIEHPEHAGIYNIGTGKARSWNDLAKALFKALQKPLDIEYIEMPDKIKEQYQYFTQADMNKLASIGCHHPCLSLEEAIKDYVGYLKNHSYL